MPALQHNFAGSLLPSVVPKSNILSLPALPLYASLISSGFAYDFHNVVMLETCHYSLHNSEADEVLTYKVIEHRLSHTFIIVLHEDHHQNKCEIPYVLKYSHMKRIMYI